MASPYECIMGKDVPVRLKKMLQDHDDLLKQQNPGMSDDARAALTFDQVKEQLNLKQTNLLRQAEVQSNINKLVEGKGSKEQVRILLNLFEGSDDRRNTDFLSVAGVRNIERAVMDGMIADMYQNFVRRVATPGTTRNKALQRNVAREAFGTNTGDRTAKDMKDGLRKMEKYVVDTLRQHGVKVGYDPDRQFIVHHRTSAFTGVNRDTWVADIIDRLDLSAMKEHTTGQPFTRQSIRPVLNELFDVIRTGGSHAIQPGKKNFLAAWQRADQSRFFIWNDFDAWEGYNQKYGFGDDYFTAIVKYTDRMARDLALFKVLGPDWDATNNYVLDLARKAAGELNPNTAEGRVLQVKRAIAIATGDLANPGNRALAEAGSSTRNVIQSAVLGSTAIVQLTGDSFLQHSARKFNGLSTWNQIPQFISALGSFGVHGAKSNKAYLALRLGLPIQSIQHSILGSMRAIGEFDGSKWSHMVADTNFRMSGMTTITDAQQSAFSTEFVVNLTESLGKSYKNLRDPMLGKAMDAYGISEADWLRVSKVANTFDNHGVRYLDLLNLREIEPEIGGRILQMIHSETSKRAVLTSTPKGERRLRRGTRAGTAEGELARLGTNLMSWPATYMWAQLGARMVDPALNKFGKVSQIAMLQIGMTVMGGLATYARDIAQGKDPQALDNPDFWLRAAAVGGSMGLLGDFLFREHYSAAETMANSMGPGVGLMFEVGSMGTKALQAGYRELTGEAGDNDSYRPGRDALKIAQKVTPLSSLWYAKAGIDRIVFDSLGRMVDKDYESYLRNSTRRAARDHGQTYWWDRGELTPDRAPDLGKILE